MTNWSNRIREELTQANRPIDEGVVEEFAQHAAAAWEAARADGASVEDAEAGVYVLIATWCRETNGPQRVQRSPLLESAPSTSSRFSGFGLDIKHALRLLRRQPGFALVSIAMIALGIGATTTLFSVVNGVLLKPLPWPNAGRLVRMSETREGGTVNTKPVFTNATYLGWMENASTIDALAGWSETTASVESNGVVDRIPVARVTATLFPLLGVAPFMGQGFTTAEDQQSLVILSYGFWKERFGGAPDVIGRVLHLASGPFTVVGVMPNGFIFPTADARMWLPSHIPTPVAPGGGSTVSLFDAVARLKPGMTPAQAGDEAQRAARALPDLGPVIPAVFGSKGIANVTAKPLAESMVGDVRPVLWILLAAVALLWLAAIGNVASMQMAHAVARRREVAIRAAIGAGSGRLVRQLLVENGLLALAGGVLGVMLTAALLRILPTLLPADFPRAETIVINGQVLAFGALLAIAASAAIAILPARLAASLDVRSAMALDAAADTNAGWRYGVIQSRHVIVAAQVAIAAVLLVGGMLLGRSFLNQLRLDRGFDVTNVLTARVQLPPSRNSGASRTSAFSDIIEQLRLRPGVRDAGLSDGIPLGGTDRMFASTTVEPGQEPHTVTALLREVTPGYFAAVGMRVAAGRALASSDSRESQKVVVVNKTFARKYLGASPVGEVLPASIENGEGEKRWTVVGVLDDALRSNAGDPVQPEIFVSMLQLAGGTSATSFITIRTTGDPGAMAPELRRVVREVDSRATIDQVLTMEGLLMRSLARPRLYAVLLGGFAVFALLIAGIGLFGGLSYGVTQRTREISLRTALGATPGNIIGLVVKQGAAMTISGVVAGFVVAALSVRYLAGFIFGITTHDVTSFAIVGVALAIVGIVASAIPARRAARLDPLKGLKS